MNRGEGVGGGGEEMITRTLGTPYRISYSIDYRNDIQPSFKNDI